ncbi:hypothetical protein [Rhodocyclus tenuis]|uniref:hypothetical protein n=1 Tax=Rhodocyclus tenuis TaxID=1066 RepID=UPI0019041E5F|nr:hypothetical protein [Rhodocyclus tenuis]MBK1679323.1 hypothetical protein [Rhodocyclus tenuis]
MEEKESLVERNPASEEAQVQSSEEGVAHSRRRLFRQGAAVVAVTLVSRPVLAWHCKSPSAWGSEQLNPNTSLKTNAGHASYADETWTIDNWVNNTSRNNFGQPWGKLKSSYSKVYDKTNKTGGQFDFRKVTVGKLFSTVGALTRPSGMSDTDIVVNVLNTKDFRSYVIVAQLNYLLLAPLATPNDLDRCVTLVELKEMATGTYTPPNMRHVVWGQGQIIEYLNNNWIVVP